MNSNTEYLVISPSHRRHKLRRGASRPSSQQMVLPALVSSSLSVKQVVLPVVAPVDVALSPLEAEEEVQKESLLESVEKETVAKPAGCPPQGWRGHRPRGRGSRWGGIIRCGPISAEVDGSTFSPANGRDFP